MIKVEIPQLGVLLKTLESSPELVSLHLNKAIAKSCILIQGAARKEAPRDTGTLMNQIQYIPGNMRGIVTAQANYSSYVHGGSMPHAVSAKQLEGWAGRHGLNPYAVANSIKKKGTKANPFMLRGAEASIPLIGEFFDEAVKSVTQAIIKD